MNRVDEIAPKERRGAKKHAEAIIAYPVAYTVDDVRDAYIRLNDDKRLSVETKHILGDELRKIYRSKKAEKETSMASEVL